MVITSKPSAALPRVLFADKIPIMNLIQYILRNMHTVFALLCFVVVIHWLIFPYPSGLLHWHCCNLTIAPVPAKQPWWIWINTSCEFIMNDCTTTTRQSTTKPCAYFLGYTVSCSMCSAQMAMVTNCSMVKYIIPQTQRTARLVMLIFKVQGEHTDIAKHGLCKYRVTSYWKTPF